MGSLSFDDAIDDIVRKAIKSGDYRRALEVLARVYHKHIRKFCIAWCKSRVLGEEVAQEVFLAAHRALPRFQWKSSLRTWLFSIARYQCLNASRKGRIVARHLPEEHAHELMDDFDKERGELAQYAWELLDTLDENKKQIVLMRCIQGLTHGEIAEILEVSERTVKRQWGLAIHQLRQCLEGYRL